MLYSIIVVMAAVGRASAGFGEGAHGGAGGEPTQTISKSACIADSGEYREFLNFGWWFFNGVTS